MKIFLVIYDRGAKKLMRVNEYDQTRRAEALRARHDAEMAAMSEGRIQEIVLLEADSLDALKRTHGSYFYTVEELGEELLRAAS